MTIEQEEKLKIIREDMNKYDKAITVFDINKHCFANKNAREKALDNIKKHRFGYLLRCFKCDNKNHIQLCPKGFFGGETVEVDSEFVDMCLEYFKKKRKALDDAYDEL